MQSTLSGLWSCVFQTSGPKEKTDLEDLPQEQSFDSVVHPRDERQNIREIEKHKLDLCLTNS